MDKIKNQISEEIHESIRSSSRKTKQRLASIQESLMKENCDLFDIQVDEEKKK